MTSTQTPSTTHQTAAPQSKPLAQAVKMAAATFAILYLINGTATAAGYVKALPAGDGTSAHVVAQTLWVGVTWPVVLHDMMRAEPLDRIGIPSDLDA
jgi:hypothetical protein